MINALSICRLFNDYLMKSTGNGFSTGKPVYLWRISQAQAKNFVKI